MNNSFILQGKDENEIHLLQLHENAKKTKRKKKGKKKENAKERKKKTPKIAKNRKRIFSRTKTQKKKTKNQILEERCKLSSGE